MRFKREEDDVLRVESGSKGWELKELGSGTKEICGKS